jgi:hypothetical protein
MDCRTERKWISDYVHDDLGIGSRWLVRRHLQSCAPCFAEYERLECLRGIVRSLPQPRAPKSLRTRILLRISRAGAWGFWPRLKLRMQNFLQPLAVPVTGGVVAAVVSFGLLMSHLWISPREWTDDVPLTYFASAWISDPTVRIPSPLAISGEITVEAFIDDQGRMYDFRFVQLPPQLGNDVLRMQLANALLTTRFQPAMNFGRPVRGRILISYVQMDVEG